MTEEEIVPVVIDCGEDMVKAGDLIQSAFVFPPPCQHVPLKALVPRIHREPFFLTLSVVPDILEVHTPSLLPSLNSVNAFPPTGRCLLAQPTILTE